MRVTEELANRNSEDDFKRDFRVLSDASASVIHVRTNEPVRASHALRKMILTDDQIYKEWDIIHGLRQFTLDTIHGNPAKDPATQDIHQALEKPQQIINAEVSPDKTEYFVFMNPQYWMRDNPLFDYWMQHYNAFLPMYDIRIVLVTPDMSLPDNLSDHAITLDFHTPGHGELVDSLKQIVGSTEDLVNLDDTELENICNTGLGMTRLNFETYASVAIVESMAEEQDIGAEDLMRGLRKGKTEVVQKTDILEIYPTEDIENVGGMDNLKSWVAKRADCYSDEAAEFGIEPPKGLVLVGIPGSGKSLVAKVIAKEFGVPLIRMDFGAVFQSLVGSSEERMRTALKMVESMAPCVLMCVDGKTDISLADGSTIKAEDMYNAHVEGESFVLQGVNPDTGLLQHLPMSRIIRTQGKSMVRITAESGRTIDVTTDHRLLVHRKGERVWVPAAEIAEGDDLVEVDP